MRQAGYAFLIGAIFLFLAGCQTSREELSSYGGFIRQTDWPTEVSAVHASAVSEYDVQELTDASTLKDYLVYAAFNNPGLEAAFNRFKAAAEQVPQAGTLPDPRFTYRYYIEQVETRVGAQNQAFGLSQMFPWFGKLKLRSDAAAKAAMAAQQEFETAKLELFYRVKDAYYEYYYLGRAIDIVRENILLLQNFEQVVRRRYEVAAAEHPDLIRAQVELGKLEDRLNTLNSLQEPVAARLNAALNRPPSAPLAGPRQIEEVTITVTDEQLLKMMAESNPYLAALNYDIARNKTQVELAKKEYYPDVTLGVDFIDTSDRIGPSPPSDSGQDPIIAMVSVNLPIWRDKLKAGVRQARYQYNAAVRNRFQALNDLNARLKMTLYEFRDAERKIGLYRDTLLPKAIESVKASETSFRGGQSTFLEVIDAQRVLLEFELEYQRALSNKAQQLAQLEMLTGTNLTSSGQMTLSNSEEMKND